MGRLAEEVPSALVINQQQEQCRKNLEETRLAKCDVFIVPAALFYSLIFARGQYKTTSAIYEARLMERTSLPDSENLPHLEKSECELLISRRRACE